MSGGLGPPWVLEQLRRINCPFSYRKSYSPERLDEWTKYDLLTSRVQNVTDPRDKDKRKNAALERPNMNRTGLRRMTYPGTPFCWCHVTEILLTWKARRRRKVRYVNAVWAVSQKVWVTVSKLYSIDVDDACFKSESSFKGAAGTCRAEK